MKTFTATTKLEGRWWEISVTKGLPKNTSCNTQARRLDQVEETVTQALAELLEVKATQIEVELEIELPAKLAKLVTAYEKAQHEQELATAKLRQRKIETAETLTKYGLTRKETGTAMGLGPQRIQQLLDQAM